MCLKCYNVRVPNASKSHFVEITEQHFMQNYFYLISVQFAFQMVDLTSNAKFSGSLGGALSPRKLLHNLSASRLVIIPQRRDEIGIAPARRKISN